MDTTFDPFIDPTDDDQDQSVPDAAERDIACAGERTERIKTATLDALAEMRDVGMKFIRRIDRRADGLMCKAEEKAMDRVGDDCVAFERTARSVRQIIALEHETVGIRPMPRYGTGGGPNSGGANDNVGRKEGAGGKEPGSGRESLRTGSTRGTRDDLKDAKDREIEREGTKRLLAGVARIVAAADIDLRAAGMEAEMKKASPRTRVTVMIHTVPRPNFDACLDEMACEPGSASIAALIRKMAKPGPYSPPRKPP